ncbi:MAG: hypothetical protein C0412_03590 [Flavobacterium sp.]|nr:hypothetical protein [Flavobacterium sp.]
MKNKKVIFAMIVFLAMFYLVASLWQFRISGIAHVDGYWYLKVAENFAQGKGLVENIAIYFYPKHPVLETFPHPIGVYWNPLNAIIVGGIYKFFGISDFTSRLGVLLIDGFIVFFIFWLCLKIYPQNRWIAFISSLIFIIHPFTLGQRGISGMPESYDLFFITLFCYFLYKSIDKSDKYFPIAGLFGGLAYLSRNEGLWALPTMVAVFLTVKYVLKNPGTLMPRWKMLVFGCAVFVMTISPWEIRNRILLGSSAGEMKKNLLLTTEFFDVWTFDKVFSLKEYLSTGFVNIVLRRFAAFYYKSITFIDMLTWPLGIFILFGVMSNKKNLLFMPAYLYLFITYTGISLLFPASQYSAFHSPGTLLAFFIPLSISGVFYFSSSIGLKEKTSKYAGIIISLLLISFYVSANIKSYKDYKQIGFDNTKKSSEIIFNWAKKNKALDDVFMIHDPPRFHYYTNIKMVQTPMDKSWESVKRALIKYNCKYLVLVGNIPSFFSKLYNDQENFPELKLLYQEYFPQIVPVSGGGNKIKIYKVNLLKGSKL